MIVDGLRPFRRVFFGDFLGVFLGICLVVCRGGGRAGVQEQPTFRA